MFHINLSRPTSPTVAITLRRLTSFAAGVILSRQITLEVCTAGQAYAIAKAGLSAKLCLQKAAEEARFDRARKMTEVESRKKFEFLEAMCSSMDAHVRFFERGHEVRFGVGARGGLGW